MALYQSGMTRFQAFIKIADDPKPAEKALCGDLLGSRAEKERRALLPTESLWKA